MLGCTISPPLSSAVQCATKSILQPARVLGTRHT